MTNAEVRAFVEKCLASASRRLPARELLADPFLREPEKDSGDGQSKSRANEQVISSVKSREDLDRIHRSPPKDNSRRESENDPPSPTSKAQLGTKEPRKSEPEQRTSQQSAEERERLEKIERARSSRDFKVRGKLDDDEQTVFLRLKIADALGEPEMKRQREDGLREERPLAGVSYNVKSVFVYPSCRNCLHVL